MPHRTQLQRDLVNRITMLIRERGMVPGTRLNENSLARELKVSRSPIRSAMDQLATTGIIAYRPNLGFEILRVDAAGDESSEEIQPRFHEERTLIVKMAHARQQGKFVDDVSETELMRLFDVSRLVVQRALLELAEAGAIERKPGYGWRFVTPTLDEAARVENFRMRMMIEPAALLEPEFRISTAWIDKTRGAHVAFLERPTDATLAELYETNVDFHEGLACASRNRYILSTVTRLNHLRRFANYQSDYVGDRVIQHIREHLALLDHLEAGNLMAASELMREHIRASIAKSPVIPTGRASDKQAGRS